MEGARNIQPIVVKIARAVAAETRFGEVSLERGDEVAANLSLGIKISGVNAATEIVNIENSLGQLQYRSFSPQQTKTEDSIEYHSTLVRSSQ
jgi:putative ubiquitin-RnfH superfamily antitoxin RatB of RatAB toxin-antitoxin module